MIISFECVEARALLSCESSVVFVCNLYTINWFFRWAEDIEDGVIFNRT